VKLVAAGRLTDRFRGLVQKIETRKNSLWVESGIPGFGRMVFRLLVRGKGEITVVYDSLKGGFYTTKAKLE